MKIRKALFTPLLLIASVLLALIVGIRFGQRTQRIPFIPEDNKLSVALAYINKYYVDTISQDALVEKLMPQLMKELDPHSSYIPAKDMQQINEPLQGNFDGIGVTFNMPDDTVIVINTVKGGPSERAGVLAGDRIITVNDSVIAGQKIMQDSIMKLLRGESGSAVRLGLKRDDEKSLVQVSVIRGKIPIKSLDVAYMINADIGYILLTKFSSTTHREFLDAVSDLRYQGMKKLILDLRDNSGGYLGQAIEMANEFLDKGSLIVYTEGRAYKRNDTRSNGRGACKSDSLVILINEGSASASEILAGAIQDNDRGTIMGRRSFGKGLVQEPIMFNDGSGIRLTIARYYTPTGRSIQKPYDKGTVAYYQEVYNRYDNKELEIADSIHFNDSLKYITPGGRVLYGGGGIMPDIFIPIDTVRLNGYYAKVARKGLILAYSRIFFDKHSKELREMNTLDELNRFYDRYNLVNEFVAFAATKGITPAKGELLEAESIIDAQLKAVIARSTPLDDEGYYPYIAKIDNTLQQAIKRLEADN